MSNHKRSTPRQRVKKSSRTVPPRNRLVALAHGRQAGPHMRSEKAARRAAQMALKQDQDD